MCAARRCAAAAALALALPATAAADVLVVGDSLGVGTTPHLRAQLEGVTVDGDSRIGRPSPEGVRVLGRLLAARHDVVVFDLGTNDDPRRPQVLAADLAAARRLAGDRCIVVATINRPPLNGTGPEGLNAAIEAFAAGGDGVEVVDWQGVVASDPSLLAGDGVHATPAGYRVRGELVADAVRSCLEPERREALESEDSGGRASPPRPRRRRRAPPVPGIEESGVVFSEPVDWRGAGGAQLSGDLVLPGGEGPHPAVAVLPDESCERHRAVAEELAQAGIAALVWDEAACDRDRGFLEQSGDARGAVSALAARRDVGRVGVWAEREAAVAAPLAAAGNTAVDAVVVVAPVVLPPVRGDEWKVRLALSEGDAGRATAAVSSAWRLTAGGERSFDPRPHWRGVAQPVLAVWPRGDDGLPARAAAVALRDALAAGRNEDRRFGDDPAAATAWLRERLGRRAPRPAVVTPLPPPAPVEPVPIEDAGALASLPVQAGWLALPLLILAAGAFAPRRAGVPAAVPIPRRLVATVLALDVAALAAVAGAVASILAVDGRDVPALAGMPAAIAAAFVVTGAGALATLALAARRPPGPFPTAVLFASGVWLALALYWLL